MKSAAFAELLTAQAELAQAAGSEKWKAAFEALASLFKFRPNVTVKALLEKTPLSDTQQSEAGAGLAVREMLAHSAAFERIGAATSKSVAVDIELLLNWMRERAELSVMAAVASAVDQLSAAPAKPSKKAPAVENTELIAEYLKRLETALGDRDGFSELYAELVKDKRLTIADVKVVARGFSGAAGKSKKEAHANILERHMTLLAARAQWDDNDGRSAA